MFPWTSVSQFQRNRQFELIFTICYNQNSSIFNIHRLFTIIIFPWRTHICPYTHRVVWSSTDGLVSVQHTSAVAHHQLIPKVTEFTYLLVRMNPSIVYRYTFLSFNFQVSFFKPKNKKTFKYLFYPKKKKNSLLECNFLSASPIVARTQHDKRQVVGQWSNSTCFPECKIKYGGPHIRPSSGTT